MRKINILNNKKLKKINNSNYYIKHNYKYYKNNQFLLVNFPIIKNLKYAKFFRIDNFKESLNFNLRIILFLNNK